MIERWRILIVDDHPRNRETYRRFLVEDRAGVFDVACSESAQASAFFRAEPPDCVVLARAVFDHCRANLPELGIDAPDRPTAVVLIDHGHEAADSHVDASPADDWLGRSDISGPRLRRAVWQSIEKARHRTQLARCRDALECRDREMDELVSVVSHDLSAPFRRIAGFCQLLAQRHKDQLDDEGKEFIDFLQQESERTYARISDWATYERLTTRPRRMQPVDWNELFEAVCRQLRSVAGQCQGQVTCGRLPPTVMGDRQQLQRLLLNLLDNSLKFHGDRSPVVHLECELVQSQWQFSIRDNGIGIDPKWAHRIFRIFARQHAEGLYPGTGMGLAMCKRIVELHGGRIWVQSLPGHGSTFYFTLPVRRGNE